MGQMMRQNQLLFVCFNGRTCGIWMFPRLGGESEWQLLAYTTAPATLDLSHIYELHCKF